MPTGGFWVWARTTIFARARPAIDNERLKERN
jgi:hypothetical protein